MSDYQLITDATCDFSMELLEEHGVKVIPMNILLDDGRTFEHYPDYRNFPAEDFYKEIRGGHTASSSQITPIQYKNYFKPFLESGKDILYICFTSALSKTYESSLLAVRELKEKYPERTVVSFDSKSACSGEGILALHAAMNREAGMSLQDNLKWLEENTLKLSHYFTVGDLSYLKRGGRISAATAVVGNTLNIKPMLRVDEEGKLSMLATAHGRKASVRRLIKLTADTIRESEDKTIYIGHSDCEEEAKALQEAVEKEFPGMKTMLNRVGPVIGAHVGPDMLCILSFGSGRKPEKA